MWTQVIGKKSYKFENPLHQLENDVIVLNTKVENTKIVAKVLFVNGSEFPKGKPKNVITISDVKELSQKSENSEVSDALLADWKQITALAVSNDLDKAVLTGNDKFSGINIYSFVMTIAFVSLWLLWRLKF